MKRSDALSLVLSFARSHGTDSIRQAAEIVAAPVRTKRATTCSKRGADFAAWFARELVGAEPGSAGEIERWGRVYDELVKRDGRTDAEIVKVCRWARAHEFWGSQFLSPLKLRRRDRDGVMYFTRFAEAMQPGGKAAAKVDYGKGF